MTIYIAMCYEDSKHGYRIADAIPFSTLEKAKEYRKKTTLWDVVDIVARHIDCNCSEPGIRKVY